MRLLLGLTWVLAAWAPPVHGQSSPDTARSPRTSNYLAPGSGVDIDGAVARALAQEPALRAARHDLESVRGMRHEAALRPNPTITFIQQNEPGGMDRQSRLEVSWPLDLFRRSARVAVAEREVEAAGHALGDRRRQLAADVRSQYGTVAAAVRDLALLDDLVALVSRQHSLVAARVTEGATPPLERDLLHVELQRLESERLLSVATVETTMIALKRLLGLAPDEPLRIAQALEPLVERETQARLHAEPMEQIRPDVLEARSRVGAAEAAIDRARREGRPDVSVLAMYMRMDAGFPQRGFGAGGALEPVRGRFHNLAAGIMVGVPLLDRNQGEIAAARARRAAASASLEAVQLTAAAELASARAREAHAQRAPALYTTGSLELARRNLSVVNQSYDLGRATVFEVLAEQRRYLELERSFTSVLAEAFQARQALRRATGAVQ
jgi:cobalt-zinc-cadmium efflux system outer membrane protein